jgi:hypothetical protein
VLSVSGHNRALIRRKYELEGSKVEDCCVHLWCIGCAVCQEVQEVNVRTSQLDNPLKTLVEGPQSSNYVAL